jgi:hypothetical protein
MTELFDQVDPLDQVQPLIPSNPAWVPVGPAYVPGALPPALGARVWRSTAQSIPNGAWTPISFDTVRYDSGSTWVAANPTRLTCQVAGVYTITGHLIYSPNTAGSQRNAAILLNGSIYLAQQAPAVSGYSASQYTRVSVNTTYRLNVGDYVELQAWQDSGAAVSLLTSDATATFDGQDFEMAMVGGPPGVGVPMPVVNGAVIKGAGGTAVWSPVSYGTSLPASPSDGDEATLVDSITNPTYQWRFRYNAGSSSTYHWEFVGGAPVSNQVVPQETTTSATFVDLTTVGPQVTLPRDGDYMISWGAQAQAASNGVLARMGLKFGAATTQTADAIYTYTTNAASVEAAISRTWRYNALTGGTVIKAQYVSAASGNAYFAGRWLSVTPVRVS